MAHGEDAKRAIEQARRADLDAGISLAEMQRVAGRIRAERERNHFSAAIWQSMRRK